MNLAEEEQRSTDLLKGKTVLRVVRNRAKEMVVEFDDAEVLSRLDEKQLELDQIDEQVKKSQADLAIRDNQDQVELLRARYGVRRAELEVKRNELISAIDAKIRVNDPALFAVTVVNGLVREFTGPSSAASCRRERPRWPFHPE